MEITKALKEDHKELKSMLDTINSSEDAVEIRTTFEAFAELLGKHSKAEEKVVYDALIGTGDDETEVDAHEGYTEHMLADTLLKKLKAGTDPLSAEWRAEAQVMQEILEHHIKEEEDTIFDDVKDNFESNEREEMGAAFEKLKEAVAV
ncbi:hemerythrin domain-containing protein [Sphingomonas sp. SUN039]|uniref:hemerythrin domain-containing protein n=1 Tax=Sphingomonas sp. SUN039 TaxID=2937787 RepID=UPI002164BD42|nr:hemerythrin domain-containing protein [Sphingomonas sp. SUN039]UVO54066.1 hemerythrin domain-containing protein [Sphingomonas sp. SUN039]